MKGAGYRAELAPSPISFSASGMRSMLPAEWEWWASIRATNPIPSAGRWALSHLHMQGRAWNLGSGPIQSSSRVQAAMLIYSLRQFILTLESLTPWQVGTNLVSSRHPFYHWLTGRLKETVVSSGNLTCFNPGSVPFWQMRCTFMSTLNSRFLT